MKNNLLKKGIKQNVTIILKDGIVEQADAICISNKGVTIGRIVNNKFIPYGFIPKYKISKIKKRKIIDYLSLNKIIYRNNNIDLVEVGKNDK